MSNKFREKGVKIRVCCFFEDIIKIKMQTKIKLKQIDKMKIENQKYSYLIHWVSGNQKPSQN